MTTRKTALKMSLGAVAVSLGTYSGIYAADNPFEIHALGRPQGAPGAELKVAMGMCGMSCGGNMEGMDQRKKKDSSSGQMEGVSRGSRTSASGMEGMSDVEGSCGGMMKGMHATMEGMCGGMMEGMCGGNMPHGISPDALPDPGSPGAKALTRYCIQCHGLPAPGMQTAKEWPAIVGRMNTRMQMMAGMVGMKAPRPSDLDTILRYLEEHAQKPIDKTAYADLSTPSGRAFSEFCSQCHALPDPKQHTTQEWPGVVARMKGHMAIRSKAAPGEEQTKQIVGFLKRHAE
jgi:hypothetical protein